MQILYKFFKNKFYKFFLKTQQRFLFIENAFLQKLLKLFLTFKKFLEFY